MNGDRVKVQVATASIYDGLPCAFLVHNGSDGSHRAFGPMFTGLHEATHFLDWLKASPLDFDSRQLDALLSTFRASLNSLKEPAA